jgi:hypothetical protein
MAEDIAVRAAGPLHTMSQRGVPPVSWEHDKSRFCIVLKGVSLQPTQEPDEGVRLFFRPPVLFDMRLRKAGSDSWGPGFILPVTSVALSNLEPDTEYECKVSEVDLQGNPKPDSPVYTNSFRSPSK